MTFLHVFYFELGIIFKYFYRITFVTTFFLLKKHIFYNIKLFSFIFFNTLFYNQSMSLF